MSSSLTPEISIQSFTDRYPNLVAAAEALGLKSRQTFWDWRRAGHETIPEPWCWKAKALLDGMGSVSCG